METRFEGIAARIVILLKHLDLEKVCADVSKENAAMYTEFQKGLNYPGQCLFSAGHIHLMRALLRGGSEG